MPYGALPKRHHEGTLENLPGGSNSDQRVKKDVFSLDYMRFCKLYLDFIGQYPYKEFGVHTRRAKLLGYYRWFVIILSICCEILCVEYTWNRRHELDFFILGHLYNNLMVTALLLQRCTLPFQKNYCTLLRKFLSEYHLLHFEHKSDFAKEENIRIGKFCRVVTTILGMQILSGVITFNLMPVYNNWRAGMFSENPPANRTLQHSVYFELPFDYEHGVGLGYFSVAMFTFYPCFAVSSSMIGYDDLINIMVFHMWGHLNILANKIKTFPKLSVDSSQRYEEMSKEYNKRAYLHLKNIIQHYQFIKEFMADLSAAFETTLCVYLSFHQLNGCVLLLECSAMTPEALAEYFVLTLFVFQQLVQTCTIFEQISSKSDKLPSQVYNMPWEDMDTKNRNIVMVLLSDVQNTLSVKALGMLPVGVTTMSAIMRTTISYFVMLHTLSQ